ncbi:hydrogenase expression protein [miscellaneous Crenarchaeota group archaeon SMTZ1-55]|nr:MAG: hydrogenase expression protein [miscellaneous Crenarchaeota group archaeon SMTZ1-55]
MSRITMAHGAGGQMMHQLVKDYVLTYLGGSGAEVPLEALDDAAVIEGIVLKSDSHTVKPLFFPGGDIGRLAIAGTVNDIAVMGAAPQALTSGFILEEGFPLLDFERILRSMRATCREAGVHVITGDTKVVERGAIDQVMINTSGIGRRTEALDQNIAEVKKHRPFSSRWLLDSNLQAGDRLLVSGTMGDHGIALLSFREGYDFGCSIQSDVAPLNVLIQEVLEVGGVVALKDPTRGGLANALNEWSDKSRVGIMVEEAQIPVREGVRAACEMLGIEALEIGNEGKVVVGVVPEKAMDVLAAMRNMEAGRDAALIGEVTDAFDGVVMETQVGGKRFLPPPLGDPIPRIC